MASISMISAANNCSRRSGEVSTRMRVVALSTMIDALVRRFLGSCGSQAPQSLPMRGTPDEVPHPNMVSSPWSPLHYPPYRISSGSSVLYMIQILHTFRHDIQTANVRYQRKRQN